MVRRPRTPQVDPAVLASICHMLGAAGPTPTQVIMAGTLPISPVAKERPPTVVTAAGKIRRIAPAKTAQYEKDVGWAVKALIRGRKIITGRIGVLAVFYVPTPVRKQRVDVDNLLKALLDGCNGIAWDDDRRADVVAGRAVRDAPTGRVDMCIYTLPPDADTATPPADAEPLGAGILLPTAV